MKLFDGIQSKQWSNFDAKSKVQEVTEEVKSAKITGLNSTAMQANTVVGIRVQQIPYIKAAINDYLAVIEADLDGIETAAKVDVAFQSEDVTMAVQKFVIAIKEDSKKLISYLRAFNDKLSDVQSAYEAATRTLSENVNTTTNAYSGREAYKEEFGGSTSAGSFQAGNNGMPSGIPR